MVDDLKKQRFEYCFFVISEFVYIIIVVCCLLLVYLDIDFSWNVFQKLQKNIFIIFMI